MEAVNQNEKDAALVQQLLGRGVPSLRRAGEAIEFLKRIESIEERVRSLLQGEIEGHLEVGKDAWVHCRS